MDKGEAVGSATADAILVPVDFEPPSMQALETGLELGRKLGAEVVLLHVYGLPLYVYPGMDPIIAPAMNHEIASAANRALDQLAESNGGLRRIVRAGEAADQILAVIDDLHPRLVVMGTHGRSGIARWFMGSVAEQVARRSPIPVLTVRAHQESTTPAA
jgi:nucleotide-binding universal stress UspA family protein